MKFYLFISIFCFWQIGFCQEDEELLAREYKNVEELFNEFTFKERLIYCDKQIHESIKKGQLKRKYLFTAIKGRTYLDTISIDSAKHYIETALRAAYKLDYKFLIKNSLYYLSPFYYRVSNYKASIKHFYLLNHYAELTKDTAFLFRGSFYLASNYLALKQYTYALTNSQKAIQYSTQLNDLEWMIGAYESTGNSYLGLQQLDSAEKYYLKAYKMNDALLI